MRRYATKTVVAVNRSLMSRAIDRDEIFAKADIDMAVQVIVSMTSHRTLTQSKPFDKKFYGNLLDNILIPALRSNQVSVSQCQYHLR